jgi:hypothetical protein
VAIGALTGPGRFTPPSSCGTPGVPGGRRRG